VVVEVVEQSGDGDKTEKEKGAAGEKII